jgi:hypothetical protein
VASELFRNYADVQYNMNPVAENIIHQFRSVETKNLAGPKKKMIKKGKKGESTALA